MTPIHRQVMVGAIDRMVANYVFPEIGGQVSRHLRQLLASPADDDVEGDEAFAARITAELQSITRDKHVRLRYSTEAIPEAQDDRPSAEEEAAYRALCESTNFGIERVERLPMNIGCIDLRSFRAAALAGEAIAAAMTLVAHTDALIVDLRQCGGGDPATVALMSSYLFEERTHLNDLYIREGDHTEQYWTHDWVSGRRFGQAKPVYVLTAPFTFSGAEEFSYNLKNLKRATLVGETTRGGAHPGDWRRVSAHFSLFVPGGRAINPITGTNWEGVGVEPDVKTPAADALRVAQTLALQGLMNEASDADRIRQLHARIAELGRTAA